MVKLLRKLSRILEGNAKYLVRLDDACDTQDIQKWTAIENILDRNCIKPLVAVVPCNEYPTLRVGDKDQNFWEKVRSWEAKGWVIAQHGFKHLLHKVDKKDTILPFHGESEFACLDYKQQCNLISEGYNIFTNRGIYPSAWIAPCHTFDYSTLKAIKKVTNIKLVSDGIACFPFSKHGLDFLPQQLWWPKWRPFGVWTICLHPNSMSFNQINEFDALISEKRILSRVIDIESALTYKRSLSAISTLYRIFFWWRWNLKEKLNN